MTKRAWCSDAAAVVVAVLLAAAPTRLSAQQTSAEVVHIGDNDLGGTVTSANGPEAGVWIIAETTDLPTKFAKIVVTDDRGRYVMPDLPKANYNVWVRGYGLVDSPKVQTAPGKVVNLTATPAPNATAAAQYYPAVYWYSMLKIPDKSQFSGPQRDENMPENLTTQAQWVNTIKTTGCMSCHAIGTIGTRTIPKELGHFNSSAEAWERRIQSGQAMTQMVTVINRLDSKLAFQLFGDWTDRIAKGELPFAQPSRPQGVERNVVLTLWDWSRPTAYMHDEISTDRRKPTLNANGKLYGTTEESTDYIPILDPVHNSVTEVKHPVRDPKTPSSKDSPMAPSPYWGEAPIWDSQTSMHNPVMDEKGRVWITARIRPPANPDFCKRGSDHPSAKAFPLDGEANRHLSMYDPATGKFTLISTCFPTHHLIFAEDANNTLWTSAGGPQTPVVGWLDRKLFEETGDEQKAQGWTPLILDTNGNGKRDDYVEPNQPVDPTKDKRVVAGLYSVAVNPVDGTVWGTSLGYPGYVVRVNPGPDPTHTALAEVYEPPFPGYGPRGGDIDRNGVFWASLASGHLASFDRKKCKVLNGPTATGKHCPEGWTLYPFPGPQFKDVTESGSVEASYYTWVDQFNTFGLGNNVPIATGNMNDALLALVDGKFVVLRVPYPIGYFTKWMDGRIDDPNAGWKGKELWTTYSTRAMFHLETGKGTLPKVVRFQLRPDPLAR
ncbi:MAG TPA: carboxypeptidase-like regulatory domain-containing protein [Mycobacterium sp.]|nr:carboxypeptidase-like regulatory domain-containing protein [Mycobacterium sp.]